MFQEDTEDTLPSKPGRRDAGQVVGNQEEGKESTRSTEAERLGLGGRSAGFKL